MYWLKPHIRELLKLDGFLKAEILFDKTDEIAGIKKITVAYFISDYKHYQEYISRHASNMRNEAIKRFAGQFTVHRRVLEVESTHYR